MTVAITLPPSPPPTREDPANFAVRADAYHAWLVPAVAQMNDQNAENNSINADINTKRNELIAAGLQNAAANAVTATTQATAALTQANNSAASAAQAATSANSAASSATSAGTAATAAANVLIGAVTQRPALRPSMSVDWTLKPTAAALVAAGWTVSRAGEMTYFGAVPVKVAENLFVRSADFLSTSWAKQLTTVSASTDVSSGLVGVRLVATSSSGYHSMWQASGAVNLGAQTYRVRFLLKASGFTKAIISDYFSGQAAACFDLSGSGALLNTGTGATAALPGGAPGSAGGAVYLSSSITPHELGGGLFWCEIVMQSASAGAGWSATVAGYPDTGASLNKYGTQFDGSLPENAGKGIEIYAAQLQHNFDGDYVLTTGVPITQYVSPILTAAANELAYQHNSRGECIGLLQYPADTNLCLQSNALGTSPWAGSEVSATASKRLWAGAAPFFRLLKTTANAGQPRSQAITTSVAANAAYTASLALLGDRWSATTSSTVELVLGSDTADVGVNADSTAVIISGPGTLTQVSGARWNITGLSYDTPTIIRLTRTYRATDIGLAVRIYPGLATSTTLGAAILATRVHLSASPRYMPYIPTTTAAVTRGAQNITLSGSAFAAVNNPVEGTLLARASVEDLVWDLNRVLLRTDFSGNSSNFQNLLAVGTINGAAYSTTLNAGATQGGAVAATSYSLEPLTSAYSYKTDGFQLAVNGALSTLDTSGTVPAVNQVGGSTSHAGLIQRWELYPRAMTSAELAAITTPGVLV